MSIVTIEIQSLAASGHGIAENGWYVLGTFPGDTVKAQVYKNAEDKIYAEIVEIIIPSPFRTYSPNGSPFFDPNAPWQYLDQDREDQEKLHITQQIFSDSGITIQSDCVRPGSLTDHYRNKAAYAFTEHNNGSLSFALFLRGVAGRGKISQPKNILVHPMIDTVGKQFLHFFNQKHVSIQVLKYLVLRYSYHTNTVVAHILVTEKNRKKLPWKKSDLESFIQQHPSIQGILVSHSEPNIRSSMTTKDFYSIGKIHIIEKVLNKEYKYHPSQFFQIYPEAFSKILQDTEIILQNIPDHRDYELLDLFAGIGIIGIHLFKYVQMVHGIEQSPLAKEFSLLNAKKNNINNFSFTEADVDEALQYLKQEQILIVDPPRSGLTKTTVQKILSVKPDHIIYISCNPETQARDIKKLFEIYSIVWSRAYNLFPKTPHIEHVVYLQRKNRL